MSVPVIDPPEDAESVRELLREVRYRLGVCAAALFVGFVLSALPIPYVTQNSITQEVILLIAMPAAAHLPWAPPGELFRVYVLVATLVACTLSQPVHIYQGLAFFGPPELATIRRPRLVATLQLYVAFLIGLIVAYLFVLPIAITFLLTFGTDNIPGLEIKWTFPKYIVTVANLSFLLGLAFQLALWPTVLVRLGITSLHVLHQRRPYVVLAAAILAAMATPSTDLRSMVLVAAPLYLLYEAGLLVARLMPAHD